MDQVTMFRHIFEAFSSLSDAQDVLEPGRPLLVNDLVAAQERINHAKLHLDAIAQSDPETWAQAMASLRLTCSLEQGGVKRVTTQEPDHPR